MFIRAIQFLVLLGIVAPAVAAAQSTSSSDLCIKPLPFVPEQAKAEQLRIEATERAQREVERRSWAVKMFPVKNISANNNPLEALCIFRVEVVFQPSLRMVQVRAPKELLPEIEEAIKKLDVPPAPALMPKGVELTGYVVVAMDPADSQVQALPAILQPVANQLKNILPNGTLGLQDTFVVRGVDRQRLYLSGNTTFQASASVNEGSSGPVIRLDQLNVSTRDLRGDSNVNFQSSVDIPVGTQVVIGKATSTRQGPIKAVILVISGRILE